MELRFLDFLQTIHTPLLDKILAFITSLGNVGIIWIVLAVVLLILPKTRKTGIIVAAALLMDLVLCNLILKNLVARVRPYDVNTVIAILIKKPLDFSFPSGHTAASFAAMTALFLAKMKKAWIAALILAVLIAFSRLYFYVHYPTDVLGGAVVGILSGIIGYTIVEKLDKRWKAVK